MIWFILTTIMLGLGGGSCFLSRHFYNLYSHSDAEIGSIKESICYMLWIVCAVIAVLFGIAAFVFFIAIFCYIFGG